MRDPSHEFAASLMAIALGHVGREFPHKLDHVLTSADERTTPRALHPVFFGSYDWHSCVHSWWLLLWLARLYPDLAGSEAALDQAEQTFTTENIAVESRYFDRPEQASFERPYGWAWLLALDHEASRHARGFAKALHPLARRLASRLDAYLAGLSFPIRAGTHASTAFTIRLALGWADAFDFTLAERLRASARAFFERDERAPAWEPSGDDFLSPTLIQAAAMQAALPADRFRVWLAAFLPSIEGGEPAALFAPAAPSDRRDGKLVHLDGLNLSRAWCWQSLARDLSPPAAGRARAAAAAHVSASLPFVRGDYMGEHWLATFALLALRPSAL